MPWSALPAELVGRLEAAGLEVEPLVRLIDRALAEDLGDGVDITTMATVDADRRLRAAFVSRADGILAGSLVAEAVCARIGGTAGVGRTDAPTAVIVYEGHVADGGRISAGTTIAVVEGPARGLLLAERTALNFLTHLSGVATRTARWVEALSGTGAKVRDTRKTLPGLRALEKYAVRCGGGVNHRMGLYDAALVKDNHVVAAGGLESAIERVRSLGERARGAISIEVEVDTLAALDVALGAGVEEILLDNFTVEELQVAVARRDERSPTVLLEASGGLTLATAAQVAATGVDFIAVGELTHSAPALDIGLDVDESGLVQ